METTRLSSHDGVQVGVRGVVLAAGRSRRMGREKAALVFEGEPVLQRIDRLMGEVGLVPVYSLRGDQLDLLPQEREVLHDRWPDAGPLGGIATALDAFPGMAILVVPVDMPLLGVEHLRLLLCSGGADVACLGAGSALSPLPSLWMPVCRDAVVREVEARRLAVRAMLDQLRVKLATVPDTALWNVNHPDDYRELSRRAMS